MALLEYKSLISYLSNEISIHFNRKGKDEISSWLEIEFDKEIDAKFEEIVNIVKHDEAARGKDSLLRYLSKMLDFIELVNLKEDMNYRYEVLFKTVTQQPSELLDFIKEE